VRDAAGVAAVRAYLESYEPATTELLASLTQEGLGRHVRLWAVRDEGGALTGAVTVRRVMRDLWHAHVHLDDLSVAADVGTLVHASPATGLTAVEATTRALAPAIRRVRSARRYWAATGEARAVDTTTSELARSVPGVSIRRATAGDVAALFALYRQWPAVAGSTPLRRLRSSVRDEVADGHLVVAAAHDGSVVGVVKTFTGTARWQIVDGLLVAPSRRGSDIGMALAAYAAVAGVETGRNVCCMRASRLRLRVSPATIVDPDEPFCYLVLSLHPRSRFPGHRRLVDALTAVDDAVFRLFRR
jgi:hypothetical protein